MCGRPRAPRNRRPSCIYRGLSTRVLWTGSAREAAAARTLAAEPSQTPPPSASQSMPPLKNGSRDVYRTSRGGKRRLCTRGVAVGRDRFSSTTAYAQYRVIHWHSDRVITFYDVIPILAPTILFIITFARYDGRKLGHNYNLFSKRRTVILDSDTIRFYI